MSDPLDVLSLNSASLLALLMAVATALRLRRGPWDAALTPVVLALAVSVILTVGARELVPFIGHFLHKIRFACLGITTFALLVLVRVAQEQGQSGRVAARWALWGAGCAGTAIGALSLARGELRHMRAEVSMVERDPDFLAIAAMLRGKRVVVPLRLGGLAETGSLVGYAPRFGFEAVTGPYSQGDPKFFRFTVHLEWEERWLYAEQTRRNLLGAAGADYLFDRRPRAVRPSGLHPVVENGHGALLPAEVPAFRAATVVPALLDVAKDQRELIGDLVNILLPDGYQLPLVEVDAVSPLDRDRFPVVVGTDDALLAKYPRAAVLLIGRGPATGDARAYRLPIDLAEDRHFYRAPAYDIAGWSAFDRAATRSLWRLIAMAAEVAPQWRRFRAERLRYAPVSPVIAENRIAVELAPGVFGVVRQSWFPSWHVHAGRLWRTTQGLMLIRAESTEPVRLELRSPWAGWLGRR